MDYPERTDSRRALLSVFNGSKAPFVFKGPSFGIKSNDVPAIPTRSAATPYMHKELPPTPLSGASASSPPAKPVLGPVRERAQGTSNSLPFVRPLNLSPKRSAPISSQTRTTPSNTTTTTTTLASKRLSRAVRAVPAPIRPPPRLRGIAALNGPSSATTSDEDEAIESQAPIAGTTRVVPGPVAAVDAPVNDLPITPLDIPVDWDDLHECWTSPFLIHGEEDEQEKSGGFQMALQTFQQEVAGMFAISPRESIGESGEQMDVESAAATNSCSPSSPGVTREKRHGRMLVTKQLKLCMDATVQFDKRHKSHRASSGPQFKAGESFLMISPMTPCNASAGLRTSSFLDAYTYVS